jgi:hypothetical protein
MSPGRRNAVFMPSLGDRVVTVWHRSPAAPSVIATALVLFFTSAALADDWKEYENRDYAFTVHLPGDPTVETATYQAAMAALSRPRSSQ